MKPKSTQQVTTTAVAALFPPPKNLRSNIPRRKRTHFSPLLFSSAVPPPHKKPLLLSLSSSLDDVSCNTTLHSAVLPAKPHVIHQQQQEGASVSLSENSCVESCSVAVGRVPTENSAVKHSPANTTATVEQNAGGGIEFADLACYEEFSSDDCEVTSAAETFSELQSEMFSSSNGDEFIDFTDEYTPSTWLNSGSQFSEKSFEESAPSPCFSLFQEFKQYFVKLRSDFEVSSLLDDHYDDDLTYWRFEEEEDEESYRMMRRRERRAETTVKDYIEEYDYATLYGSLIAEQRLLMVNWIIEVSRKKDLQKETMFLAVRLFDRFLSKGFFTSRRNLQILAISCLTLAIRIEENQPCNSVRQKSFYVGSSIYTRTEVVAMEWVVQEVLRFHCISITIHNFLWFYLKAAKANEQMKRKAAYLAGLTLLDHKQLQFWPSSVAAAVVILVSLSANQDESCQRVMEVSSYTAVSYVDIIDTGCWFPLRFNFMKLKMVVSFLLLGQFGNSLFAIARVHARTKIDDLPECIKSLEWLVKYAC